MKIFRVYESGVYTKVRFEGTFEECEKWVNAKSYNECAECRYEIYIYK